MKIINIALCSLLLFITSGVAQAKVVKIGNRDGSPVDILQDRDSWDDLIKMSDAGVKDGSLLGATIVCKVASDTKVVPLERGSRVTRVVVIEGPSKGCRGYALANTVSL